MLYSGAFTTARIIDLLPRDVWLTLISGAVSAGVSLAISWWFFERALRISRRMFREQYEIDPGEGDVLLEFDEEDKVKAKRLLMPSAGHPPRGRRASKET